MNLYEKYAFSLIMWSSRYADINNFNDICNEAKIDNNK